VLQAWLGSPFSSPRRVLYELKQRAGTTATEIARELGLMPAISAAFCAASRSCG
jgi:hypothetical protein